MSDSQSTGQLAKVSCPFFLPERQAEALSLAALGLTILGIAHQMQIKPRTVRAHLQRTRRSLGALNTTHAVAIAMKYELIEI